LSYTYLPTGKVETINSSNAHGAWVGYTWDPQNRLSTVVDGNLSGQNTTTYAYDSASNLATAQYPNGLTTTFTYDSLMDIITSPRKSVSRTATSPRMRNGTYLNKFLGAHVLQTG
jgi:YD repeat-containing protein